MISRQHRLGWISNLWELPSGRIGLVIVGGILIMSLSSLFGLTPYPPNEQHPVDRLTPPSSYYWLGTDQFGRDNFSRIMAGLFSSLRVAVLAVATASVVGSMAGVVAGFLGGWPDRVISAFSDIMFAFPAILLALAIVVALGTGWVKTTVAIAIVYVPIFVRVARGPVLSVKEADYLRAGRVLGYGTWRLLFRHILPNVIYPIIVQVFLALSWGILTETSLSFLGLGTQPPDASLGSMVSEGRPLAHLAWWLLLFPSVTIVIAVIGLNLLGDGLRDVLDPMRPPPPPR